MDGTALVEACLASAEVFALSLQYFRAVFTYCQALGAQHILLFFLLIVLAGIFQGGTPFFQVACLDFEALYFAFLRLNLLLIHFCRVQKVIGGDLVSSICSSASNVCLRLPGGSRKIEVKLPCGTPRASRKRRSNGRSRSMPKSSCSLSSTSVRCSTRASASVSYTTHFAPPPQRRSTS